MIRLKTVALSLGLAILLLPGSANASAFTKALTKEYFSLAQLQYYYADDKYAAKAREADAGKNVMPEDPSDYKVPANVKDDLTKNHTRLVTALEKGFRESNPKEAARAQANFDCWLWQVIKSKGKDWRCVTVCRAAFMKAMSTWTPPAEAKPAPKPTPAPKPRDFVVFFGWNSAAITPSSLDVLQAATKYAKDGNFNTIKLVGHADRSGKARYNVGLSKQRADAVKAALVGLGIKANNISTKAVGEASPPVKTADGVREPQNRRVDISVE